jgi:hypothetical protein
MLALRISSTQVLLEARHHLPPAMPAEARARLLLSKGWPGAPTAQPWILELVEALVRRSGLDRPRDQVVAL